MNGKGAGGPDGFYKQMLRLCKRARNISRVCGISILHKMQGWLHSGKFRIGHELTDDLLHRYLMIGVLSKEVILKKYRHLMGTSEESLNFLKK